MTIPKTGSCTMFQTQDLKNADIVECLKMYQDRSYGLVFEGLRETLQDNKPKNPLNDFCLCYF